MATPNLIDAFKTGNPAAAFASLYEQMEVRTLFSPPIVTSTQELLRQVDGPEGKVDFLVSLLKPTIILRGNAGTAVIAPGGPADTAGGWRFAGVILAIVGVGFALGRWSKK